MQRIRYLKIFKGLINLNFENNIIWDMWFLFIYILLIFSN